MTLSGRLVYLGLCFCCIPFLLCLNIVLNVGFVLAERNLYLRNSFNKEILHLTNIPKFTNSSDFKFWINQWWVRPQDLKITSGILLNAILWIFHFCRIIIIILQFQMCKVNKKNSKKLGELCETHIEFRIQQWMIKFEMFRTLKVSNFAL